MKPAQTHVAQARGILALFCLLLGGNSARGTRYYIDYDGGADTNNGQSTGTAWQRCPGMHGFAGHYSHAPGDIFIFKGGVTWPGRADVFPMTPEYSGEPGAPIVYTSSNAWFSGNSFRLPVLDDQGRGERILVFDYSANVVVEGLKFYQTTCQSNLPNLKGGGALLCIAATNFTISRCVFETYDAQVVVLALAPKCAAGNITICSNDFSHFSTAINMGIGVTGCLPCANVRIFANHFHDPHDAIAGGKHSQAIQIWGPHDKMHNPTALAFTNVMVYDNRCDGDWSGGAPDNSCTAQMFFEDGIDGLQVFNNVLGFDNTVATNNMGAHSFMISPAALYFQFTSHTVCRNNTIYCGSLLAKGRGCHGGIAFELNRSWPPGSMLISSNIIVGNNFGLLPQGNSIPGVQWVSDHNLYFNNIINTIYPAASLSQWKGMNSAVDQHSLSGDPLFENTTVAPFDFHVKSTSMAKGLGAQGVALGGV